MTYKELLAELQKLTPEQLDQSVTIYDTFNEAYTTVDSIGIGQYAHNHVHLNY